MIHDNQVPKSKNIFWILKKNKQTKDVSYTLPVYISFINVNTHLPVYFMKSYKKKKKKNCLEQDLIVTIVINLTFNQLNE